MVDIAAPSEWLYSECRRFNCWVVFISDVNITICAVDALIADNSLVNNWWLTSRRSSMEYSCWLSFN
jgi:hypothetical protein